MIKHSHDICGFSFYNGDYVKLLDIIDQAIEITEKCSILTPTTEIIGATYKNPVITALLQKADLLLPDSITLVHLGALFGKDIKNRVTGVDTIYYLGQKAEKKYKVYFLGAKPDVIEKAVQNARKIFTNFDIVGYHHGYFSEEEQENIIEDINRSQADILFVGLGFPKQEKFIINNNGHIHAPVRLTVGGSFDVISGILKRAPEWMQHLGLEWAFRLFQEPSRITRMSLIPYYLLRMYFTEFRNRK